MVNFFSLHYIYKRVSVNSAISLFTSRTEQSKESATHIPPHWDQSALPELGYKVGFTELGRWFYIPRAVIRVRMLHNVCLSVCVFVF